MPYQGKKTFDENVLGRRKRTCLIALLKTGA